MVITFEFTNLVHDFDIGHASVSPTKVRINKNIAFAKCITETTCLPTVRLLMCLDSPHNYCSSMTSKNHKALKIFASDISNDRAIKSRLR